MSKSPYVAALYTNDPGHVAIRVFEDMRDAQDALEEYLRICSPSDEDTHALMHGFSDACLVERAAEVFFEDEEVKACGFAYHLEETPVEPSQSEERDEVYPVRLPGLTTETPIIVDLVLPNVGDQEDRFWVLFNVLRHLYLEGYPEVTVLHCSGDDAPRCSVRMTVGDALGTRLHSRKIDQILRDAGFHHPDLSRAVDAIRRMEIRDFLHASVEQHDREHTARKNEEPEGREPVMLRSLTLDTPVFLDLASPDPALVLKEVEPVVRYGARIRMMDWREEDAYIRLRITMRQALHAGVDLGMLRHALAHAVSDTEHLDERLSELMELFRRQYPHTAPDFGLPNVE
jgi:hypothetical protein